MHLDARAPLVLDTRELGRRPGAERHVTLTAPAPADLGIEVLGVPEASPVELDLRLEAVVEGVLVTASVRAELVGTCVRCLADLTQEVDAEFCELYRYEDDERSGAQDEESSVMEGDLLDLEPAVRDAVVLSLPFQPLCREDCPGLCVECGARLADDPEHGHQPAGDPRWAALAALVETQEPTGRESDPSEE